jgi:lycopene cyclase domain-containing protein
MERYQYLVLMALCLGVTLPLELVLGARVWRDPSRLLRALVPVFVLFYTWDALAIARDHWHYSTRYTTGWLLPFSVPVEEAVFFVVVPVCGLLTLEAVRNLTSRRVSTDA